MGPERAFGGTLLWSATVGDLAFSETLYAPGTRMPRHMHPTAYLCLVRRGGFTERWRSGGAAHLAGDIIFHAADDEHADAFGAHGARCFNVELSSRLAAGLGARCDREVLVGGHIGRILASARRELDREAPSTLVAEGLVYQALGEAFQREEKGRRGAAWLERVRDEIETRFDQPLSVTDLAASVGVHPVHLSRAFHRRYGTPLLAALRARRVSAALDLVRRSTLSLADVAAVTGFADQSHLTRAFRRALGRTPGRIRRGEGAE